MTRILRFFGWSLAIGLGAVIALVLAFRLAAFWREFEDISRVAPATGQHVQTPHGRVFVQSFGPAQGQAVLLVPGTAAWGGFWEDVAMDLARSGYRAITVDLPPFGYSDHRPTADYSRVDQAERLNSLIAGLGLKSPIVLGHSFGAGAVAELAAGFGGSLKGIVLVCGALGLPPGDGRHEAPGALIDGLLHHGMAMRLATSVAVTNPLAMKPLLGSMLYRKEAADDRQAGILLKPMVRAGTTAAYADWLPVLLLPERGSRTATAPGIAAIKVPTALIWGEKDSVTPLPQGERLKSLIAGSSLDVIKDVGHIPHIEAPEVFLKLLKDKLETLSRPS